MADLHAKQNFKYLIVAVEGQKNRRLNIDATDMDLN